MDKLRIILALLFCLFSNIIIKVFVLWVEDFIKKVFTGKEERIIKTISLFYPFLSLIFVFTLAWIYPAIILFRYQYVLNVLSYAAVILAIYHWFLKPIINKILKTIKDYQIKIPGGHNNEENTDNN